jgi:hypothetical protein
MAGALDASGGRRPAVVVRCPADIDSGDDDPSEAMRWPRVFQTAPGSGDPLACVALAGAQLMLGTSLPEFLSAESRAHKGARVEFHVTVPGAVHEAHRPHAESVTELADQPWVSRRFTRSCLAAGS